MAGLYREFSTQSNNRKLLTSVSVLTKSDVFTERVRLAGDIAPRFHYLHACLTRSVLIINTCFHQLVFSIRYSMADLEEIFMTTLYAASHLVTPKIVLPAARFNWFRDYLKAVMWKSKCSALAGARARLSSCGIFSKVFRLSIMSRDCGHVPNLATISTARIMPPRISDSHRKVQTASCHPRLLI